MEQNTERSEQDLTLNKRGEGVPSKPKSARRTRKLVITAMLSAIAYGLAWLEFPMPLSPPFARMDFSDIPALIATFAIGPLAGVAVELVKNALQALSTSTAGIGELANFIIGAGLVLPAGLIYRSKKTKKRAIIACVVGVIVMAIVAALANYFILLPMFSAFMPIDQIIAMFTDILPFIHTKLDVILLNCIPGNIVKGFVICLIVMLLYKRLSPLLKGKD